MEKKDTAPTPPKNASEALLKMAQHFITFSDYVSISHIHYTCTYIYLTIDYGSHKADFFFFFPLPFDSISVKPTVAKHLRSKLTLELIYKF